MGSLLQFSAISIAIIAFSAGTLLIALWALSFDDDRNDERAASSLLWSWFWPLIWLYRWLAGKNTGRADGRTARSNSLTVTSQVGVQEQEPGQFRTIREAKEYLVGIIVEEAKRNGAPLTEVERKMLYFTETGWTLPEMKEVSSEFDRDHDQDKYEQKIASLIGGIQARLTDEERMAWERALEKLSEGDHYLLVLVDAANPVRKGAKHNLKMLIIGLVFLALAALGTWFRGWLRDH